MAIAITELKAFGTQAAEPVTSQFRQTVLMRMTGLATDLVYDLGNPTGAFWTAVTATDIGKDAFKTFVDVQIRGRQLIVVGSQQLLGKVQALTVATGTYGMTIQNATPNITFFTAQGPTNWILVCEWILKVNELPVSIERAV